ncbi:MAG: hypothetical protein CMH11_05005 [Maritimibacter sp.]|nr:hypothetical protein [Maritimibacter sp.]
MPPATQTAQAIEADPVAAYAAHHTPESADGLRRKVPEHMQAGMVRYILLGIIPGSFLSAVLEGDLFNAVRRADDANRAALHDYAIFLFNYAPGGCFGSEDRLRAWSHDGGLIGILEGRAA